MLTYLHPQLARARSYPWAWRLVYLSQLSGSLKLTECTQTISVCYWCGSFILKDIKEVTNISLDRKPLGHSARNSEPWCSAWRVQDVVDEHKIEFANLWVWGNVVSSLNRWPVYITIRYRPFGGLEIIYVNTKHVIFEGRSFLMCRLSYWVHTHHIPTWYITWNSE